MKKLIAFVWVLSAVAALAGEAPRKLTFERNDNAVWIANLDGSSAKKIAAGVDPDISPDGTKIAYNTEEGTSKDKGPVRHIAVVDTGTGKSTVFKDTPGSNCYGPVWSPDGTKILFYIFIGSDWGIGLINTDGTGFRMVKKGGQDSRFYSSACWLPDGKSLFCQDLDNIYRIDLDGAVLQQWPIKKLFTGGDMDSGMRFSVSPDGNTLLVDFNGDEEHAHKDWDGPAPSIMALDLKTEKSRKVTPSFFWQPRWISNDEFLCIAQGEKEKQPSVYRMSIDGKSKKLVVKNARMLGASK